MKKVNKYWENEEAVVTATENAEVRTFVEAGKIQLYSTYYKDDERNRSRACVWSTENMEADEAVRLAYAVMQGLLDSGVENDAFSQAYALLEEEVANLSDGQDAEDDDSENIDYEGNHVSFIDGEIVKVGKSKKHFEHANYIREWIDYIAENAEEIRELKGKARKEAIAELNENMSDFIDEVGEGYILDIIDEYMTSAVNTDDDIDDLTMDVISKVVEFVDGMKL